jgi:NgoFVII restriction endonuclease
MARIDKNIFLSRPGDIDVPSKELASELNDKAGVADQITILSAYHNTDYIRSLLTHVRRSCRRACSIRLVFGMDDNSALAATIDNLRKLRSRLRRLGFDNPYVGYIRPGAPFHVKLFYFKCGTRPFWYLGSANAS